MSINHIKILRAIMAKTVANGCTEGEAEAARAKAEELIKKLGLSGEPEFAEYLKTRGKGKAKKAKASKPRSSQERASKAERAPKDDGRLREILVVVSKDARGRKQWRALFTCKHCDLKTVMKETRAKGYEAKSRIAK